MITPEYLEQCPDRLVEIYEQAERDIIADMARKISKYDYFSSAAEWQAMKLQEMGLTYKEIQKRLAKASGKTKAEIVKLLKEAGAKELKDDGVKPTQSTVNTLNAGLSKTLGTFDNLTRTTATQGTRQISQALDRAYAQVSSGAFSQETAVKNAISDLAKNGIEAYDYGTRKDYIDVVVRRAVRTGVNQTVAKLALSNADELKTDLVEVSAHSGARPSHAEWQGKVYSISGETEGYEKLSEATGYGSVTGLCGANCRHTFYPFFEGDEPTYSEEELKSFDKPKYTYNGEKMTEYEATQRQRYIERQIRRWKREKVGMKAAGLSTDKAESKIKHWNDIREDFLKQTGLKRQYGREDIPNKGLKTTPKRSIIEPEVEDMTLEMVQGEKVIHEKLGKGVITASDEKIVTIKFDDGIKRRLGREFAEKLLKKDIETETKKVSEAAEIAAARKKGEDYKKLKAKRDRILEKLDSVETAEWTGYKNVTKKSAFGDYTDTIDFSLKGKTAMRKFLNDYTIGGNYVYSTSDNIADAILRNDKDKVNQYLNDKYHGKIWGQIYKNVKILTEEMPVTEQQLFRYETTQQTGTLEIGKRFEWGLRSTSANKQWAEDTASRGALTEADGEEDNYREGTPVIFEIIGGKKAIEIKDFSEFPEQEEWLVSGVFEVVEVAEDTLNREADWRDNKVYRVKLKYVK